MRQAFGGPKHDPLLLAPYLFAATRHLGVVPTVNPAASLPYPAARQFATLQSCGAAASCATAMPTAGCTRTYGRSEPTRRLSRFAAIRLAMVATAIAATMTPSETQVEISGAHSTA